MAPLILLIASVTLFKERFSRRQWLGVAAFTVGMVLFFHQRLSAQTDAQYYLGAALVLVGAVSWSIYGMAQKRLLAHYHAKDILLLICVAGTLLLAPLSTPSQIMALNGTELAILLFCGLNTIVAYGCFGLAMSHWEASRVSAIVPAAPLFTLLFSYLFNASGLADIPTEPMDWLVWLGATMVVVGGAVAAMSPPAVSGAHSSEELAQ